MAQAPRGGGLLNALGRWAPGEVWRRASRRRRLGFVLFLANTAIAIAFGRVPFSVFAMFSNQSAIEMRSVSFRVEGKPVDIYDYTDFAMTVPPFTLDMDRSLSASGGDGGRSLREMDAYIREHPARGPAPAGAPTAEILLMTARWDDSFTHLTSTAKVLCSGPVRRGS